MKKSEMKLEMKPEKRATFVDMSTGEVHYEESILRIDHRDELLRKLEKSSKRYECRRRKWRRAEKIWGTASVTMITAAIMSFVFLAIVTINAMYRINKIAFHIDSTIVLICGIVMSAVALAAVAQIIAAKILERG